MAGGWCPQCGRETWNGQICSDCEQHRQAVLNATNAAAWAAEESAAAEWERTELLEEQAEQQAQRREHKQLVKTVNNIISFPQVLQGQLAESRSIEDLWKLLAGYANGYGDVSLKRWHEVRQIGGHRLDIAYADLRRLLVPVILLVWSERQSLNPSPDAMLRSLATSFRYTDLAAAATEMDSILAFKSKERKARRKVGSDARDARESEKLALKATGIAAGAVAIVFVLFFMMDSWGWWFLLSIACLGGAGWYGRMAIISVGNAQTFHSREAQAQQTATVQGDAFHSHAVEAEDRLRALEDPQLNALLQG